MIKRFPVVLFAGLQAGLFLAGIVQASAFTHFVEAEAFEVKGNGWRPFLSGGEVPVGAASGAKTLWGGGGAVDSTATTRIEIATGGNYRLWIRYMESSYRGPFTVRVQQNGRDVATKTFDQEARPGLAPYAFAWNPIDNIRLVPGSVTIQLEKYEEKNANIHTRHVDCFLLTDDLQLKPSYVEYGPKTWLRITLGNIYAKPVYVEIFADYFRDPWFCHYSISKAGLEEACWPSRADSLLHGGESTGWVNISRMVFQDTGVNLNISVRESYANAAPRLKAKFEFATAPSENAIVKTFERDAIFEETSLKESAKPGIVCIAVPPDLSKKRGVNRLLMDLDFAERTGRLADETKWPSFGKKPERYPFLIGSYLWDSYFFYDKKVLKRENKTLDYFGFNNQSKYKIPGGVWIDKNDCYSQPDIPAMKASAAAQAELFRKSGKKTEDIVWSMLMDEPVAQPLEQIVKCPVCMNSFREWLQGMKVPLAELGVADWNAVKPVLSEKDNPALYYYSQKFRVHALGNFIAVQRQVLKEAYGRDIPAAPNFSDGATYQANFYFMGIDYFELLDSDSLNAIWSENWGNGAASEECTTYNVELMRSAAMKRGQALGQYQIAHAGRLPWDVELKVVSQAARDIKVFENFWYGPSWSGHEGGPTWDCTAWYSKPYTWLANAETVREIGGAEDLLYDARKAPSSVGIIYSSSADIWTLGKNNAYGFDRMFTWLALTHDQIPVDFLSEKRIAEDKLDAYRVLYLSGPNLTRAAASKLVKWVDAGGTLVLTAGAASRDEYNRPMDVLNEILPGVRSETKEFQVFQSSGGYLDVLQPEDSVLSADNKTSLEVLSVKQSLTPKPGSEVLAAYADKSPAYVSAPAGQGRVYQAGFLPGLSYMHPAIVARKKLEASVGKQDAADIPDASKVVGPKALLRRSWSPWEYPAGIRELIANPVIASKAFVPIHCDVPLVDAVLMEGEKGAVVPLSNFTLQPRKAVTLNVVTKREVKSVESVRRGKIAFTRKSPRQVEFTVPLQETDFILLRYDGGKGSPMSEQIAK